MLLGKDIFFGIIPLSLVAHGYHMICLFLYLFLLLPQKKEAKKSGFFADMIATRSVHLLTAAAKVNWTLSRFCTPLYEAGHSHRIRTACRHSLPQSSMACFSENEQSLCIHHSATCPRIVAMMRQAVSLQGA